MPASRPRTIVLGDVHLTTITPKEVARDLADVVEAHPGARIAFAGDMFDLSAVPTKTTRAEALVHTLHAQNEVRAALATHLERGGELWMVAGNHDAEIAGESFASDFGDALELSREARARLRTSPWFLRAGGLHLEHGHVFDPDNAPAHPLDGGSRSLGVHFTEEFIAKSGAHRFLNANDGTPLKLFLSSFTWYGPRAPFIIYRYFHAAIAAIAGSGRFYDPSAPKSVAMDRVARFAETFGLDTELLAELAALGPEPTLASMQATFSRLYFDRVVASASLLGGMASLALGMRRLGTASVAAGSAIMLASWVRGHNRYQGTVVERLDQGARLIADTTDARLVVFGHTHRESMRDRYANTASFSFPVSGRGRPFLEIEGDEMNPRAVRRFWAA